MAVNSELVAQEQTFSDFLDATSDQLDAVTANMDPHYRDDAGASRLWGVVGVLGIGSAVLVGLHGAGLVDINIPGFEGGKDEPTPHGGVIYEGQEARTATEEIIMDLGTGDATVSVKARQNHDEPGACIPPFQTDCQSTNGTSSVRDPDDHDNPARLTVQMRYCAEGQLSTEKDEQGNVTSVTYEQGEIFVCDATLRHTRRNDRAFNQDDTPNDFHGDFVAFVSGAVETTAKAAPCPTDEINRFTSSDYVTHMEGQLSQRWPGAEVTVNTGTIRQTDADEQRELQSDLESYNNHEDPDSGDTFEALDISYLSGQEAVADSCFHEPERASLDSIENAPEPQEQQTQETTPGTVDPSDL